MDVSTLEGRSPDTGGKIPQHWREDRAETLGVGAAHPPAPAPVGRGTCWSLSSTAGSPLACAGGREERRTARRGWRRSLLPSAEGRRSRRADVRGGATGWGDAARGDAPVPSPVTSVPFPVLPGSFLFPLPLLPLSLPGSGSRRNPFGSLRTPPDPRSPGREGGTRVQGGQVSTGGKRKGQAGEGRQRGPLLSGVPHPHLLRLTPPPHRTRHD